MTARIAILGNASGGKSTLARRLAEEQGLPLHEVDKLLWRPGWVPAPMADYEAAHDEILRRESWLLDGFGRLESIGARLARATTIVLVDLPLWVHFWLAEMPPTERLFETIWSLEQEAMPELRRLVAEQEARGRDVRRLLSLDAVEGFRL